MTRSARRVLFFYITNYDAGQASCARAVRASFFYGNGQPRAGAARSGTAKTAPSRRGCPNAGQKSGAGADGRTPPQTARGRSIKRENKHRAPSARPARRANAPEKRGSAVCPRLCFARLNGAERWFRRRFLCRVGARGPCGFPFDAEEKRSYHAAKRKSREPAPRRKRRAQRPAGARRFYDSAQRRAHWAGIAVQTTNGGDPRS